jgi:hypothetical protein
VIRLSAAFLKTPPVTGPVVGPAFRPGAPRAGRQNTCDLSHPPPPRLRRTSSHSTHGEIVAFVLVSSTALHAGLPRPALHGPVRGTRQSRKTFSGSHPKNVVNKMLVLPNNRFAFNALQPPAGTGILCLPSRRIGRRWRATRAPRWRHTARAVFLREDRMFLTMPLALSDKRILVLPARPNILRPRFWDESPFSTNDK